LFLRVAAGSISIANAQSLPELLHSCKARDIKFSAIFRFPDIISSLIEATHNSSSLGNLIFAFYKIVLALVKAD